MADDRFRTTHWSLIEAYQRSDSSEARDQYLNRLSGIYWTPVNAFLRRKGYTSEAADDLTQYFFSQVVLGRELFARADREKGRLRTLMFTALRNIVIDDSRGRDRAGRREASTDPAILDGQVATESGAEGKLFFQGFFGAVLELCFERCEQHYVSTGKERLWRAYEAFVIRPIVSGTAKPSLRDIAATHDFVSVAAAGAAIYAVKERLKDLIRLEIRNVVANEADVEEEYQYLVSLLG